MLNDYKANLRDLLLELFQFDTEDLDFGIYRILNEKRKEIQKFIDIELIDTIEREFERNFNEGNFKDSEILQQQKAELLNHIYQFFSRYYLDGDFISQKRYSKENKYIIPYNGEEVLLYWANFDQYYIKTADYYSNYAFREGPYKVWFKYKMGEITNSVFSTEKKYMKLSQMAKNFVMDENKKELNISFESGVLSEEERSKYGRIKIQQKINKDICKIILDNMKNQELLKYLKEKRDNLSSIQWHINKYTRKIKTDFFIHKNLKKFFEKELDFYIKNEILVLEDFENPSNLAKYSFQIQLLKNICYKIICFLGQIEDFQKKLYEKKKLVIRTDYCISLGKVPRKFFEEILLNRKQINEWVELFKIIEEEIDIKYLQTHPFLVLDTVFFSEEFKYRLLANFENFDEQIGGVIIKSENWQALNLLFEKYRGKIKCIYIDPPYNTGNDEFIYKDNYQHSCWLSMLRDRLILARELLSKDGVIFVSIDDNEMPRLRLLLDWVFGEENFLAQLVWRKKYTGGKHARHFADQHDYIVVYGKDWASIPEFLMKRPEIQKIKFQNEDEFIQTRGKYYIRPLKSNLARRETLIYPISLPDGSSIEEQWMVAQDTFQDLKRDGRILFKKKKDGNWQVYRKYYEHDGEGMIKIPSILNISSNNEGKEDFKRLFFVSEGREIPIYTIKPVALLSFLVGFSTQGKDHILDFFAGTGTTAQAVLERNKEDGNERKYLLVEMGDYFDTILKPRMKKLMFSKIWKDGNPNSSEGHNHLFKYQYLEQYDDSLRNIEITGERNVQQTVREFDDYFLQYMLDFETRTSPSRLNLHKITSPSEYKLYITDQNEIKISTVDLIESFNYFLGLNVKSIKQYKNNGVNYKIISGERKDKSVLIIWRAMVQLDLVQDKDFINNTILKDFCPDTIYINGDNYIEGAIPIELELARILGE